MDIEEQKELSIKVIQGDTQITKIKKIQKLNLHSFNFILMIASTLTGSQYFNGVVQIIDAPRYLLDTIQEINVKFLYKYRIYNGEDPISQPECHKFEYLHNREIQKIHELVYTHLSKYQIKKDYLALKREFQNKLKELLDKLQRQIEDEEEAKSSLLPVNQKYVKIDEQK